MTISVPSESQVSKIKYLVEMWGVVVAHCNNMHSPQVCLQQLRTRRKEIAVGKQKKKTEDMSQVYAILDMIDYLSKETRELSPVTAFLLKMAQENLQDDAAKLLSVESQRR